MEYTDYLRFYQSALFYLGLWPIERSDTTFLSFYFIHSSIFLGSFCALYNISEFLNLFFIYKDLKSFSADLSWFLLHFITIFKILVFLKKIKIVRNICSKFVNSNKFNDDDRLQQQQQQQGFNRFCSDYAENREIERNIAVKESLNYIFVYYAFSVAVLLNGFIAPIYREGGNQSNLNSNLNLTILERDSQLPYYTYVFCDVEVSLCYEIFYIYQMISTCVFSLVIIHCDNFYIFLVKLCVSELKILGNSIENFDQRAAENFFKIKNRENMKLQTKIRKGSKNLMRISYPDCYYAVADNLPKGVASCCSCIAAVERPNYRYEIDKESLRLVNNCVEHHIAILEVFKILEDMYNLLILAQFLSHLIQLCFQMFLVTEVSALSFDGLSMIAFVIAMIIEVYVFCQCGSEIENQSIKISQSAYNANWTSSSEPVKKTLLLMMLRAQHPVQFTAGKFAKLSLATLVSVLKGSFSYFMVLRGIQ